jgi:hypothetical protein
MVKREKQYRELMVPPLIEMVGHRDVRTFFNASQWIDAREWFREGMVSSFVKRSMVDVETFLDVSRIEGGRYYMYYL